MNREINPQLYARIGGVIYVVTIVLGLIQELFIRGRVTFANLQQMEMVWRTGIAIEMVMGIITVVFSMILYVLTKPIHKELALLALLFCSIATTVETAYAMQLVDALLPLGTSAYLKAFTPAQLQALTALAMKSHVIGFGIALLFFGPFFIVTGYLIFRSGFWPKAIGVLYQIAGVAYMFNGFTLLLAPQLAGGAFMIMFAPAFIGETSFALFLLIKGVRMEKWRELQPA